jgi:hypothetical protein
MNAPSKGRDASAELAAFDAVGVAKSFGLLRGLAPTRGAGARAETLWRNPGERAVDGLCLGGRARRVRISLGASLFALVMSGFASAQTPRTPDVLIHGARVFTMTSKGTLENADVLIRNGKISAVGTNLTAPAGTTTVEANGRALTPGIFGGLSTIGLQEVQAEASTNDGSLLDAMPLHDMQFRPEFDPTPQFNPRSVAVPVARVAGITWTVLQPSGGTFIAGQGSAVTLDGRFDAAFDGSRSLFVNMGSDTVGISGGSRAAQFMLLDQAVRETKIAAPDSAHALLHPAGREALKRYLAGGRVVFDVDRAVDIRQVIAFAQQNGMKPVIAGGAEAWVVATDLARAKVPVLLDPLVNLPSSFDKIAARADNAALLNAAGVRVAFMLEEDPTQRARRIRQVAGNAAAHGLPRDVALAAITSTPAEIFGLGASHGHIAAGQAADVVLWSGDPLEVTTLADQVWIAGNAVQMTSRQTELRDRYLERIRAQQAR